jgi:hypothetical protein
MRRRPFVLTDLEDRALAACDDQYLKVSIAQAILSSWFARSISTREMRLVYRKLSNLGLLHAYMMRGGRAVRAPFPGCRTASLIVRSTVKGRSYLSWPRRVV